MTEITTAQYAAAEEFANEHGACSISAAETDGSRVMAGVDEDGEEATRFRVFPDGSRRQLGPGGRQALAQGYKVVIAGHIVPARDVDAAGVALLAGMRAGAKVRILGRVSLTRDRDLTATEHAEVVDAATRAMMADRGPRRVPA